MTKKKSDLVDIARTVVTSTIKALDPELRVHAEKLPVFYRELPDSASVDEDDDELLGLFEGPSFEEEGLVSGGIPARIILFVNNIFDEADEDLSEFKRQTKITYLHELGHYLGLDEDQLHDRNLD